MFIEDTTRLEDCGDYGNSADFRAWVMIMLTLNEVDPSAFDTHKKTNLENVLTWICFKAGKDPEVYKTLLNGRF